MGCPANYVQHSSSGGSLRETGVVNRRKRTAFRVVVPVPLPVPLCRHGRGGMYPMGLRPTARYLFSLCALKILVNDDRCESYRMRPRASYNHGVVMSS
jgi:hypothetical protein